MTRILHLDSSPRGERSHSRQLTNAFVEEFKSLHPNTTVSYRDIGHNPPPHVTEPWVAAAYSDPATHTPELQAAIALSNELVDELLASDVIVLGAPMHNFSIPSTLKAYIDQIVRVGRTFTPSYEGLVTGKKLFLLTARGASGYSPGEPMEGMNFQDTYIKAVLGFLGIRDVTVIHDEKTLSNESNLPASIEAVKTTAREYASSLA
ncbi:FMN-dependent NADH-azoreductase 1 [Abditibacteriota bacterium]|nr:FMN-dependent NADH-azoreductase 1 [Abditibacteriota bacterium]